MAKMIYKKADGTEINLGTDVIDDLTSTDTDKALSANQGKVLNNKIDNIPQVTVEDSLTSTSTANALSANQGRALDNAKMKKPIYSTKDLTPGVSDLEDGQIYIVYYN